MKKLFFMAMLCCMIIACTSNGRQSGEGNEIQEDSLAIEKSDSNELATKDTVDVEVFLEKTESALSGMKQIHIKAAEDTLKYEYLKEKWDSLDHYAISNINRDEMRHSVKIRYLQTVFDFLSELKRLSIESKEAGIKNGPNEEEIEELEKMTNLLQRQLWLETH